MKLPQKINFNKIITLFEILAKKSLFTLLLLFCLSLIIGSFLFFKYYILPQKKPIEIKEKPIELKEKNYLEILNIWEEREKRFEETKSKEYLNPFSPGS